MTQPEALVPSPLCPDAEQALIAAVGADHAHFDDAARSLAAGDIFQRATAPAAVIAPQTLAGLMAAVKAAARYRLPIVPRGGGMSYTQGYVSGLKNALAFDLRALDRILEIDGADMRVRVEAGATWAALDMALKPQGLRTPFWGPLSGLRATIGGSLSQHAALLGAGRYGAVAESVVGLTIVSAQGEAMRLGAGGEQPFFRHFGPDLMGLFLGDCGALGVKAEASLRLIQRPACEAYCSFAFPTAQDLLSAMGEAARADLAAEMFGFDPILARQRLKRASLAADLTALAHVAGAQKSLLAGAAEAARVALAGRSFLDADAFSLHVALEGRSRAAVDADLIALQTIVSRCGGREIENTIPKVLRAAPFQPLNAILGPKGERWTPVHGIVRWREAAACLNAIDQALAQMADSLAAHQIVIGRMFTTVSTNACLIEPVLFWPDAWDPLHESVVEPQTLARFARPAPNEGARFAAHAARAAIIAAFGAYAAAHFQIGRSYPYRERLDGPSRALFDALKAALDPLGVMNPGVLAGA